MILIGSNLNEVTVSETFKIDVDSNKEKYQYINKPKLFEVQSIFIENASI
jgi:hypothetical protein